MANIYNVDYSDKSVDPTNKQPLVIPPGAWDTSTSLSLPGYSAALYGEHIAENFIHLMENFASETQPVNPTVGQLWYVPSIKALKVLIKITTAGQVKTYTWRTVGAISTTITPPDDQSGLWYDTSNADPLLWQLKIFNTGTGLWTSVADRYVVKAGDTMTGHLETGSSGLGYISTRHTVARPEGFFPLTASGPAIQGTSNVNVFVPSQANGAASFVVSATNSQDPAVAYTAANLMFQVVNDGTVIINRNNLNMNNNKVINVKDGVAVLDAVNVGQLNAVSTSLGGLITGLQNSKVDRAGDTMTGALTINTANAYSLTVNGTGTNSGGILVNAYDNNNDQYSLNLINPYGPGGTLQSVFNVKAFTGDTIIGGNVILGKTLVVYGATTVQGTFAVAGTSWFNSMITMDQPMSSVVNARHLTTKEYVDQKIEASKPTETYARVNPASPRNGDILVSGAATYIYNNGWNQVFPAQWAP
ncbi:hypothetical protein D3C75_603160 [compost metagenome]